MLLLQIGEQLKEKFDSATEVEPRTSHSGSRRHLVPRSPTYKPHTDADLVYLDRSPDYCEYDSKTGSLGTHGRPCNKVKYTQIKLVIKCLNETPFFKSKIDVESHRWLRPALLQSRLQEPPRKEGRTMHVQIPLVLSRRVQDLHQNCRRSHLQVDNTQAKRH